MLTLTHIDEILPHIKDKPEFKVIDRGDYTVIDYVYQMTKTFDNPYTMECRGIKFDKEGKIIARPFKKFFNYGERGTTIDISKSHYVTKKLDGSMIHPCIVDNKLYFMTKKGHTDVAIQCEEHFLRRYVYFQFMADMLRNKCTPIFEYTGPDNRIVINYEEPKLTLLAIRDLYTGKLLSRKITEKLVEYDDIPIVETVDPIHDIDNFLDHTKGLEGEEGYVIYFDDPEIPMVKIKSEEYVLQHRTLDDMSNKPKVMTLCLQGFADDVSTVLQGEDSKKLIKFNNDIWNEYDKYKDRIIKETERSKFIYLNRKQFALGFANKFKPEWLQSCIWTCFDDGDIEGVLKKLMIKNYDNVQSKWNGA